MKYRRNTIQLIFSLLGVFLAVRQVQAQSAPPQIPSSFYGTVTAVSNPLSANTAVSASINGVEYAHTTLLQHEDQWVYTLKVPGDDPVTEIIEGGKPGDTIQFYLDGKPTGQTAVWQSGINTSLDLSLPGSATAEARSTNNTMPAWLTGITLVVLVGLLLWFWQKRRSFIATRA